MTTTILSIPGLDCPAEEQLIRNVFNKYTEISKLEFNFIRQELSVTHSFSNLDTIKAAISSIGMQAFERQKDLSESAKVKLPFKQISLLAVALIFALSAELLAYLLPQQSNLVLYFSLIAILLTGKETLRKGFIALRNFMLNINFLMVIAIMGAFIIGEWPEAAMVTTLFALAELIERYSLDKARHAIDALTSMAPATALVKTSSGDWQEIAADEVKVDDIVRVKPGERIALDGILISGQSSVNQAAVTGESLPVTKQVGDVVYAGTLNERGSFEFKVSSAADATLLAKIIHTVESAQAIKAPTQRFVDNFSRIYTPLMVIIALLIVTIPPLFFAAPLHEWIVKALVVLIIACPCALVISTPVTVVSALAAAAKNGLLIKGGSYLEMGHKLKAVAFDKTGTLTQGKPVVTDVINLDDSQQTLWIAASLNTNSEHPIAGAILSKAQVSTNINTLEKVEQFEALVGKGVYGIINQVEYWVGNHSLVHDRSVCSAEIEQTLTELEQAGKTTVAVMTKTQVIGIIAVADSLRASSKQAIAELKGLGIATMLLTGDNVITANSIGKSLGIDEVHANLLPEDKMTLVTGFAKRYGKVGMIGDGINDAPALASADIGFTLGGGGTDIALETADVVLMDNQLTKLTEFIRLSQKTMQILIQNISLAIGIKLIFFVLALLGIANLWMAVFADMGTSMLVIFNGLRILRVKSASPATHSHVHGNCSHHHKHAHGTA
ncbi:MAG: heavy metal translocating P-type ATPase [Burkholderiales bacterium]|nr:heavy metal translocating P-type ATPase [Burkholderiales bacterium]